MLLFYKLIINYQKDTVKKNPYKISSKYLGINIIKEVKELYSKNYKT